MVIMKGEGQGYRSARSAVPILYYIQCIYIHVLMSIFL